MKFLIVLFAVCALASSQTLQDNILKTNWLLFKRTHKKTYATEDEEIARYKKQENKFLKKFLSLMKFLIRFNIWKSNLAYINKHNQEHAKGVHSFDLAMNKFGDLVI